jgi:hypothetical protein
MRRKDILSSLLELLEESYVTKSTVALKARQVVESVGGHWVNDHIAFRTFGLPGFGIASVAAPFEALGYERKGEYYFEEKKLRAIHLEYSGSRTLPKIFVSELMIEKLSPWAQTFLRSLTRTVDSGFGRGVIGLDQVHLDHFDSVRHGLQTTFAHLDSTPWPWIAFEDHQKLKEESEYASWVAAFGNRVNHFTVAVHYSRVFDSISAINSAMQKVRVKLNDSGGLVKGSQAQMLEQSSTVADLVYWPFKDGELHVIPYAYIEFAYRFPRNPEARKPYRHEDFYHGFEEKSADKIFESTYEKQAGAQSS